MTIDRFISGDANKRHRQLLDENKGKPRNVEALNTAVRVNLRKQRLGIEAEGLAFERILGNSDLVSISYLDQGIQVAKPVGRITVRDLFSRTVGYATGFLVSPKLLLTNWHVFNTAKEALKSLVEFNYQDDAQGKLLAPVAFALDPDTFFLSSKELDYALVAVADTALDGTRLATFPPLQLVAAQGKLLVNEYVSIIQHPKGEPKQVALRENEVLGLIGDFVQYKTDTEPGSSGSPVFNDQWEVVALHHSGVPRQDDQGRTLLKNGTPAKSDDDPDIDWIANEGIRVSSLCQDLKNRMAELTPAQCALLTQALDGKAPSVRSLAVESLSAESYTDRSGYDEGFLGKTVPLPALSAEMAKKVAAAQNASGNKPAYVLDYSHFSVVMNKERRIAFFSAANIDGGTSVKIQRKNDVWYVDERIGEDEQSGPDLYANNDLDRGHLTRREDPVWGDEAALANEDTFHFTNCSPQHKDLNQKTWLDLENYILEHARAEGFKVSVFTGPVFRDEDMEYRGYQIPAEFWKVAVIVTDTGELSATAYLQSQKELITNLEFAYGPYKTYQVSVSRIETLTGLDFGGLKDYDPMKSKGGVEETARAAVPVNDSFSSIVF